MKNKKVLSTSLSLGLSLALLIGNVSGNMNNVKAKEQGEKKQIYMIQASSEEKLDEVEHKYSIAETSAVENTDSVSTIYLTTQEAKELNEKEKNLVVEKDKVYVYICLNESHVKSVPGQEWIPEMWEYDYKEIIEDIGVLDIEDVKAHPEDYLNYGKKKSDQERIVKLEAISIELSTTLDSILTDILPSLKGLD